MRDVRGDVHFHSAPQGHLVPMQVQPPPADYVNHEGPQSWVRGFLDPDAPPRVLVYGGPRGIGKTSLLAKIAYATHSYFTGGQLTFSYARGREEDSGAALAQFLRALAVSRWIEEATGWSIRKFVTTLRRYRTVQIQAGEHVITAADPLPADVGQALEAIKARAAAH